MDNEQFIADGIFLLKNKVNIDKLKLKLERIKISATDDYAVDEVERTLSANGYEVVWSSSGYRIV